MAYLTGNPIDAAALLAAVEDPTLGGTCVFLGSVRRGGEDGPVSAIEYSAYEEMAEAELGRIVGEAQSRWPAVRFAIRHRVGRVPAGEASVAVAAASAHRGEAFEACRHVVEQIKQRLPVWKKEMFEDGSALWRSNDGTRAASAPPGLG